ncbi:hypothetical protein MJO28_015794 [Puccinia striiformis f. sp. tritici]|uniref:Exosome complex component RRP45 n=4 Tax=Puccinia striiformis TaxID=27350 RepID=A0A0L0V4Q6_9BASI|nr:hypothetical protein Pst134EA_029237 [Puccinia striiformis f. sp. tritici]KAI9614182.1 hypothetical protein H4Q26_009323 [Puccinia striiformis f. sp. tritici PST-130]KNE94290.1 hypothetical protein PSTG_12315 [Puccinia striiformis f. sp. tritici PST-78]POW09585.1 hypothetical protein PSTT_06764 [Puccinia striiformis]KAH9441228.1 hypothetical protein Pst134EB_029896 [Puccinia striiformis f. sp. tritici]KAH9447200.1 hypothetical protein Pst134EA_029237 [Puccinia striiformis f. sp. tritici]
MVREAQASILEREFLIQALKEGIRLDGRALFEQRPLSLSFADDGHSVDCSLGNTRVAAHVSASITKPWSDRPFEGLFQVSSEINPLANFTYDTGRSSDNEIQISRMLDKSLSRSGVIDKEALCILAGQMVWSIRLDLHFLNDEGNLLDCASIAAIAALQTFQRPDVQLVGEEITIHSLQERVPVPLTLHHTPICLTFGFFELNANSNKPSVVLDPDYLEEQLSTGTITVALNPQKEICVVNKSGGVPLSIDEIMNVVKVGSQKVKEVDQLIKRLITQRDTGVDLTAVQDR